MFNIINVKGELFIEFISAFRYVWKKILVISQSTKDRCTFLEYAKEIEEVFDEVRVIDSICDSSLRRQEELYRLCDIAEAVVVVGGKHSSNTVRLCEVGRSKRKPTFHVTGACELNEAELMAFDVVAVAGGASTPKRSIMQVVEKLKKINSNHLP